MPTFMKLLTSLVSKHDEKKPMLCLVASMILKSHSSRMALAQCGISLMLYGNGATKQVLHIKYMYIYNRYYLIGLQLFAEANGVILLWWHYQAS